VARGSLTFFFSCFAFVFGAVALAGADVRLPKVLGDHMVLQRDKPIAIWGWAEPGEKVTVTFAAANASAAAGDDGKWSLQLPAQKADSEPKDLVVAGANTITLTDILVGEVWLCSGQSNMEWPMSRTIHGKEEIAAADHPQIRLFNVQGHINKPEPQEDAPGAWQACTPESVAGFSGVGYHFGQSLGEEIGVPIGLIGSNWGGTKIEPWTAKVGLEQVAALKENPANGGIYNGMIHPLAPYSMRGAIWYQGESNCLSGDTTIYTDRTLALVKGWQSVFQQDDLSFYFVQLAPFTYAEKFKKRNKDLTVESLPRFWEAQTACLEAIPNSGMVVISDITGNVGDIHPVNKRDVGKRLARWALAKNYGKEGVVYSGPMFRSMAVEGGKVTLSFDHVGGGLKSLDGEPLSHFTIAAGDQKFVPAEAVIEGDTIVLSTAGVTTPVAVRYAWHETAIGNFANAAGLPAVPFRSDDW
jgi:sialate O-acetylesterase